MTGVTGVTAGIAAAAVGLTGCTAEQRPTGFWAGFETVVVEEVDPARDLDDLARRSETILRGRIAEARPKGTGTLLTLDVAETLLGEGDPDGDGETVVHVAGRPGSGEPPADELLWYLEPGDDDGALVLTDRTGAIGPDSEGGLTTLFMPTDAERILTADLDTLGAVQARTEELLGP